MGGALPLPRPLTPARVWWLAARPATLAASVAPVLAGTAVAAHDQSTRLLPALAALLVAIAMQVGVNYANDYSDFIRGADTPRRVGPVRAAASGLVPPAQVRLAALAAFAVAAVVGLGLSLLIDWRLIAVGALAVAAGWLYTGGPRPYGYLGLGEVFVFLFFGLVATVGTTYVQEQRLVPASALVGCSLGFLACAILVLNNLRDIETDAAAGKRTLAVKLGRAGSRRLLLLLFGAGLVMPIVAVQAHAAPRLAALPLIVVPQLLGIHRLSASTAPGELVRALKRTAEIELWFALLFTAGMVL